MFAIGQGLGVTGDMYWIESPDVSFESITIDFDFEKDGKCDHHFFVDDHFFPPGFRRRVGVLFF